MNWKKNLPLLGIILFLTTQTWAHIVADDMLDAAKEFLESLKPEEREKATFPMNSPERVNWSFVPKDRRGLALREMSRTQRDLVHALLDTALSQRGYVKATTIISLEKVLHDLENQNPIRQADLYYLTIFGEPAKTGAWGWRFEGHHLALNFTIVNNEAIACAPSFFGANPAELKEGPRQGMRTLAAEEDWGRQLVQLLDDEQKKIAIFSTEAPKEIITRNDRRVEPLSPKGISFEQMNRAQCQTLLTLTKEYLYRFREEVAEDDWRKIQAAGFEKIFFAWAGGLEPGQGHYYRIQGPTFLLEYDNTQNDAQHVHTVWREFTHDFGEDLLKKHYDTVTHGKAAKEPPAPKTKTEPASPPTNPVPSAVAPATQP